MADTHDGGTVAMAWASALLDALADRGVDTAVVAPGSRSTPLVLAAADHDSIATLSHLDERSAAYFALGRGRATGEPTALITTSGTATANALPAVVEAHEARVPLIVLTADRPPELIDSGANQTIDQPGLYGGFVRYERTLGEPSTDPHRLRAVRTAGTRAVAEALGPPAGPVHLNCPFRKPLEPPTVADRATARRLGRGDTPSVSTPQITPDDAAVAESAAWLNARSRRLIVVGPAGLDADAAEAVLDLADAADMAVVAGPASGLRFADGHDAVVCAGYDGYLEAVGAHIGRPDIVLRIGPQPVSTPLRAYLDADDAAQVLVDPMPAWQDADHRLDAVVRGDIKDTLVALADAVVHPGDRAFLETIERAERAYWSAVDDAVDTHYFEGAIAHRVATETPDDAVLFAGNSMPIRDLDRFGPPRRGGPAVVANRGASGIDGTVSTALGAAHASGRRVVALLGDLAAYHDGNGLLAVDRFGVDATLVVVNNDGGGIFHLLPVEDHDPPFTELFTTPHGLDFEHVARQYGLDYVPVDDHDGLDRALAGGGEAGQLIECRVDGEASHRTREAVTDDIAATVRDRVS